MKKTIILKVNSFSYTIDVKCTDTLLKILRDNLGLMGTKYGCGTGDCGACTVLLDNKAVPSCMVLAVRADGHSIETIEGLSKDDKWCVLPKSFVEEGAIQCGYCTPGMIMSAKYLLLNNPNPSEEEIKNGLVGNLCRCTGYKKIIKAIKVAASKINKNI